VIFLCNENTTRQGSYQPGSCTPNKCSVWNSAEILKSSIIILALLCTLYSRYAVATTMVVGMALADGILL